MTKFVAFCVLHVLPLSLLLCLCLVFPVSCAPGDELYSFNNGLSTDDVATDSAGFVYVTDFTGCRVLVFSPVTSSPPFALLYSVKPPSLNVALTLNLDSLGNVYVVSEYDGIVLILASINSSTPLAELTTYSNPNNIYGTYGVALDRHDNIYLTDSGGFVSVASGLHSTNPSPLTKMFSFSGFSSPQGVAVDSNGTIYVADQDLGGIFVLSGINSTVPGTQLFAFYTGLGCPYGVRVDAGGNMIVSDPCLGTGGAVVYLAPINATNAGAVIHTFTNGGQVSGTYGASVDKTGHFLYMADAANSAVLVVAGPASVTPPPDTLLYSYRTPTVAFLEAYGIVVDSKFRVYVSDVAQNRVVVLAGITSVNPAPGTQLYSFNNSASPFSTPTGLCLDKAGNLYVSDKYNDRIVVLSSLDSTAHPPGTQLFSLPASQTGSGPRGCFIDPANNIYVGESGTGNISVLSSISSSTPGMLLHRFNDLKNPFTPGSLHNIVLDSAGRIYAPDNNALTLVVLQPVNSSFPLGTEVNSFNDTSDPFESPGGVAVDSLLRIYVSDSIYGGVEGRVKVLTGVNSKSPAPGTELGSFGDSTIALISAKNVALDPAGNMYATDSNVGRVSVMEGFASATALGDPQFHGFLGQSYQVHGVSGLVYSLISTATLQLNARFSFLSSGGCPVYGPTTRFGDSAASAAVCWTHPGSYFGALGVRTGSGAQLRIEAGEAAQGCSSIQLNGAELAHRSAQAEETGNPAIESTFDLIVTLVDRHHITVEHGIFTLSIDCSDHFINLPSTNILSWSSLTHTVQPHGLLGQTWQRGAPNRQGLAGIVEGSVDDYADSDNDLFGINNKFSKFQDINPQPHHTK